MTNSHRTTALSTQLTQTHHALREQLRSLRHRLTTGDPERPGGTMGTDLRQHCLAFCAALEAHHTGEDDRLFAALQREHPELAPTIDKLIEDHQLISGILHQINDLLVKATVEADPSSLVGELDGLAAIMESHFAYEERRIRAAMDTLTHRADAGAEQWSLSGTAIADDGTDRDTTTGHRPVTGRQSDMRRGRLGW